MVETVEGVTSLKSKRTNPYDAWQQNYSTDYDNDQGENDPKAVYTEPKKKKDNSDIPDTLNVPPATQATASTTEHKELSKAGQQLSVSTVADIGKKIWDWFCAPITVNNQATGTSSKSGGDGVSPVGGPPAIEPPILIDKEMVQKAIQELKESSYRLTEILNENDDNIREDERKFLVCFKIQNQIREEGVMTLKFQLIFDQKKDRTIRKEQSDYELQRIEVSKKQRFWSWVNTGLLVGTVVVTVALVASGIFAAAAGATIPVAVQLTLSISQAALGISSGGAMIIKAELDRNHASFMAKTTSLRQHHIHVVFKIKDEMGLMKDGWDKGMKCFEWLKQVLDNMKKTSSFILSR